MSFLDNIGAKWFMRKMKAMQGDIDELNTNLNDKQPQITGLVSGNFRVKFTNIPADEINFNSNGWYEYPTHTPSGCTVYGAIGQFIGAATVIITSTSVNSSTNYVRFNARKLADGSIYTGGMTQGISVVIFYVMDE